MSPSTHEQRVNILLHTRPPLTQLYNPVGDEIAFEKGKTNWVNEARYHRVHKIPENEFLVGSTCLSNPGSPQDTSEDDSEDNIVLEATSN